MLHNNLFVPLPSDKTDEVFTRLVEQPGFYLERIVSHGQATPPGQWYDQVTDEWVVLLSGEAELRIEGEDRPRKLLPGDYLYLPAGLRHRVESTSTEGATIWLALHWKNR